MIDPSKLYHINTIDELIDLYISDGETEYEIIPRLVKYNSMYLLSILEKSTNVPSKYDLRITTESNKFIIKENNYTTAKDWIKAVGDILEFYKNRK